jgi:hypothetical protein
MTLQALQRIYLQEKTCLRACVGSYRALSQTIPCFSTVSPFSFPSRLYAFMSGYLRFRTRRSDCRHNRPERGRLQWRWCVATHDHCFIDLVTFSHISSRLPEEWIYCRWGLKQFYTLMTLLNHPHAQELHEDLVSHIDRYDIMWAKTIMLTGHTSSRSLSTTGKVTLVRLHTLNWSPYLHRLSSTWVDSPVR